MIGYPHTGRNESVYLNWLNNQLSIGNSSYDFTFVSFHRPPFDNRTGGDAYSGDDNPDIIKFKFLCFIMGVWMEFSPGHNHLFAHQNLTWDEDPVIGRNPTYIISGASGGFKRTEIWKLGK